MHLLFTEQLIAELAGAQGCHSDISIPGLIFRTNQERNTYQSCWYLCTQIQGRQFLRKLGEYPRMRLAEARDRATLCQQLLADCLDMDGHDVSYRGSFPNFRCLWRQWVDYEYPITHNRKSKLHKDCLARGIHHLFPYIGEHRLDEITPLDLANILNRGYESLSCSTVKKIRQNLLRFFSWARASQLLSNGSLLPTDPTYLDVLIRRGGTRRYSAPHPAISQKDLPRFVFLLTQKDILLVPGVLPLLFTLLTASRIGNVVGSLDKEASMPAKWSDFSHDNSLWIIPASNMKTGQLNGDHIVPLSMQAQRIVWLSKKVQERNGIQSEFVFPNRTGKRFDYRLLSKLIKQISAIDLEQGNNGFIDEESRQRFHIHGMRSSFKKWGTDHGIDWTLTELALHHRIDKLKYDRSKAVNRRKHVMQQWADFCFSKTDAKWYIL